MKQYLLLLAALVSISAAAQNIDSLENVLHTQNPAPAEQLGIIKSLSWLYLRSDLEKAVAICNRGIELAEKENDPATACVLSRYLGYAYSDKHQFDSAKISLDRAIEYARKAEDLNMEMTVYVTLGSMYQTRMQTEKALECFFKALAYYEKEENRENELSTIYSGIGTVYGDAHSYEQALEYSLKALEINRKINNEYTESIILANLASYYRMLKEYAKAMECAGEAETLFRKSNNITGLIHIALRLASLHSDMNEYEKALEKSEEGLKMAQENGFPTFEADALGQLSGFYYQLGKYRKSEETALKALELYPEMVTVRKAAHGSLLLSAAAQGNTAKAYGYLEAFDRDLTELTNENFQSSLAELEVKYETEKKELHITSLEKEKRLMLWLSIAGGILLLLLLTTFISLWRWTVQKKHLAENRRELAEHRVKQLEQEKQLVATQAVLDGETQERTRLARDLHDGLGGMLSAAKLNLSGMSKGGSMEGADVQRFNRVLVILEESIQELRRVSHNMMPDSLLRYGLKVALTDFCNSIPNTEFHWFGEEKRLDSKLEIMIYRTAQELVNNVLKHAGSCNTMVQITQESDRITLTVQDDGCGFDTSAESKGMGLQNIRNRAGSCNGQINVWSEPGKGTEVLIDFNL
jgi:signal transduction histidine kinase/Tfp pilus assembly protein PilF